MDKKQKHKELIFWIVFIFAVLFILEATSYLTTGYFVFCGRYTGCAYEITGTELLGIVFLFGGASLLFRHNLISKFLFKLQWRNKKYQKNSLGEKIYDGSVIFGSIILLVMSYVLVFGPITL